MGLDRPPPNRLVERNRERRRRRVAVTFDYRTDSLRRDLQAFRNLFENAPIGLMEDHLRHILEFDSELLHHLPQSFFQTADCLTKERGPVHVQGMALCFDRLLRRRGSRASSWNSNECMTGSVSMEAYTQEAPPRMAAI